MKEGEMYCFKPFRFTECKTSSSESPTPRSGHKVVTDSGTYLYLYGGFNPILANISANIRSRQGLPSQPLLREIWRYHIASRKWTKVKAHNFPMELPSSLFMPSDELVFVYGGTSFPFGEICSSSMEYCRLEKYETSFNTFEVTGSQPTPLYGQGTLLHGHYFYTVGGTTGYEFGMDVHRLNLRTHKWEQLFKSNGLGQEPTGRYRHEICFDGEKIYLLGGGSNDFVSGFEVIPAFDISTHQWSPVKTYPDTRVLLNNGYPIKRKFHTCVQVPDEMRIVMIGGFDIGLPLKDSWILDLRTFKWEKLFNMNLPVGTYFHASAVTPCGKVYTFGGVIHGRKFTERTSSMFSSWVKIPSLKEICWDALLFYGIASCGDRDHLAQLGLPIQFLERLDNK